MRIWPPGTTLNNIQSRYKKEHYAKPKHTHVYSEGWTKCFQAWVEWPLDRMLVLVPIKGMFLCAFRWEDHPLSREEWVLYGSKCFCNVAEFQLFQWWDYIPSDGRPIEDLEKFGRKWSWPNRGTISTLVWRNQGKSRKTLLRLAGAPKPEPRTCGYMWGTLPLDQAARFEIVLTFNFMRPVRQDKVWTSVLYSNVTCPGFRDEL